MKNADKFVVGGLVYDVLSPATFGDYMETIGSACINPDGYAENKLFLAYDDNVQKLFRATTAIAYSELLNKDTNCEPTTMAEALANALSAGGVSYDNTDSGLTASNVQDAIDEVNGDVETVKSDLSNDENAIFNMLGAKNLCRPTLKSDSHQNILFTPIANGGMNISGTSNGVNSNNANSADDFPFTLKAGTYKLTIETERTDIRVRIINKSGDTLVAQAYKGDDTEFTLDSSTEVYSAIFYNTSGVAVNDNVYVMIRPASVADKTYVPYAKTNRELTENEPKINLNGNGSTFYLKTIIIDDVCMFALKVKKTAVSFSICQCPFSLADKEIVGRVNINGTTADVVVIQSGNYSVLQIETTATDSNWRYVSGVYRIA